MSHLTVLQHIDQGAPWQLDLTHYWCCSQGYWRPCTLVAWRPHFSFWRMILRLTGSASSQRTLCAICHKNCFSPMWIKFHWDHYGTDCHSVRFHWERCVTVTFHCVYRSILVVCVWGVWEAGGIVCRLSQWHFSLQAMCADHDYITHHWDNYLLTVKLLSCGYNALTIYILQLDPRFHFLVQVVGF